MGWCPPTNQLLCPARKYIAQIARFDPSKCIPDTVESYRKLYARRTRDVPESLPPLCDPRYAAIIKYVVVMRIGPSDQMWNAMITATKLVVQISFNEGIKVKVSEALNHGKHVVATRAVGIPPHICHGKFEFLKQVGNTSAVANLLFNFDTNSDFLH
ncbi:hypothetical protein HOY80DRAFT_1113595 [Tuber brumale]|nr:hypothetical protein HOY80DRAFT_1113595 [Tuber brumale]